MGSGYVLDFFNSTFRECIFDSVGKNIYDDKYAKASGSKANRLRAFWAEEPNHIVGKLLSDLLDHYEAECMQDGEGALLEECRRIASRLLQSGPVDEATAPPHPTPIALLSWLLAPSATQSIAMNQNLV